MRISDGSSDVCSSDLAEARVAYAEGDLRSRLARYHTDVDAAFRGWSDAWLDPDFERWDIRAPLADITVPVLAIQGESDQRPEERRVGKECVNTCRCGWSPDHSK